MYSKLGFVMFIILLIGLPPAQHQPMVLPAENLSISKNVEYEVKLSPAGEVSESTVYVTLDVTNKAEVGGLTNITDRIVGVDFDTIEILEGGPPFYTYDYPLVILEWYNVYIHANSNITIKYKGKTSLPPPIRMDIKCLVNGAPTELVKVGGSYYLPIERNDTITISMTITNALKIYSMNGSFPLFASVSLSLQSDIFDVEEVGGQSGFLMSMMGLNIATWNLILEDEPVKLNITARVKDRAEYGITNLEPVKLLVSPLPESEISKLLEQYSMLKDRIGELKDMRETFASIEQLNKNITLIRKSEFGSGEPQEANITFLLNLTTLLYLQLEGLEQAIRMHKAYMDEFIESLPPEMVFPIVGFEKSMEGMLQMFPVLYAEVEIINQSLKLLNEGIAGQQESFNAQIEGLESVLSAIENTTQFVNTSSTEISGEIEELNKELNRINRMIEYSSLQTIYNLAPSIGEHQAAVGSVTASKVEDGYMKIEEMAVNSPNITKLILTRIRFNNECRIEVEVFQNGSWAKTSLSEANCIQAGQNLLVICPKPHNPSEGVLSFNSSRIRIVTPENCSPTEITIEILQLETNYTARFNFQMYHSSRKLIIGGTLVDITLPPVNQTGQEMRKSRKIRFERWMWYPILSAPIILLLIGIYSGREPEIHIREDPEVKMILERINKLKRKSKETD